MGASERVFQLLDRAPAMLPSGAARPTGAPEGADLVLKDVWCAGYLNPEPCVETLLVRAMTRDHGVLGLGPGF